VLPAAKKKTVVVRRILRCSGACGCEQSGQHPCRVRIRLELFDAEPTCWVVSRNYSSTPLSEAVEHAPTDPSQFVAGKRRMSLIFKDEIEDAITNRVSPAKFLAKRSADAVMANTAVQNGVPTTAETRQLADLQNTTYHPPLSQVVQAFKDAKKRRRIQSNDVASFDTMTSQLSGLHGWVVVHRKQTAHQGEVLVLIRRELAIDAIRSCMGFGWDASSSLNAYGFKHWELTAMSIVDGSLKGVSVSVCASSAFDTHTQTVLVEIILSSITRIGVEEGLLVRGELFRPTVVCIDKR
jgi:hypothetical protein